MSNCYFVSATDCALALSLVAYIILFVSFTVLLSSKIRRYFRKKPWYKYQLNIFLLIRQILFFLLPLWIATVIATATIGATSALNQLPALIALGLSIIVFWVVELPLLMKADILVTFGVDDGNAIPERKYSDKLVLVAEEDNIVNTRIHNMGFSTLKNARIEIYFGDGFEVVPFADARYRNLDFTKKFSVMKTNCGVIFSPMDSFQTLPPQEVFIFQTIVHPPRKLLRETVIVHFASENSWGLREIEAPIEMSTVSTQS